MRLSDIASMATSGFMARLRRDAIAYGVCAVCAIAAIWLAAWASVLALVPHVGAVLAPLIVAAAFAVIAIGSIVTLRIVQQRNARPAPALGVHTDTTARSAQFAQLAMIVEAVLLGYSLSRRSDRR